MSFLLTCIEMRYRMVDTERSPPDCLFAVSNVRSSVSLNFTLQDKHISYATSDGQMSNNKNNYYISSNARCVSLTSNSCAREDRWVMLLLIHSAGWVDTNQC